MRGGHRRATGCGISGVTGVTGRARAGGGSGEIRLYPVAPVPDDRPAATKRSDAVSAGYQRANRVRRVINGRRIRHGGTTRPRVTGCNHHLDTSGSLSFNGDLQLVADSAAFRGRATPGVNRYVRCLGRIALSGGAVDRIRRQEKLHALDVSGRCAVAHVHVPAPDPLCAGSHPDLVTHTIIADRSAEGVATVEEIVAREWRIVATRVADAVVNRIVPVEVVICVDAIPASIVRLKRVMRPAITRICAGNHDVLTGVPKRPDLWRVRIIDSWFDRSWPRRRFLNRAWLRQVIMNNRVAFNASHPRECCQCLSDLAITLHQNCVDDVERLILNFAFAEPLQNGRLRRLALAQQRFINVAALFSLGRQTIRAAQVSLIG